MQWQWGYMQRSILLCVCGTLGCGGRWIPLMCRNARYNHRSFKTNCEIGQKGLCSIQNLQLFADQFHKKAFHQSSTVTPLKMTTQIKIKVRRLHHRV